VSGREAVNELLALATREDVVDAGVVARAVGVSKRQLLRDWRVRRKLPITRVGRDIRLSCELALRTYFPHRPEISGN
jgi:hypothetical protein